MFISPAITAGQPKPNVYQNGGDGTSLRGQEYNEVTNRYARVIVDEVMPVITSKYNISPDPDLHAIAGSSSGAIAAFGVASVPARSISQSHQCGRQLCEFAGR